MIACVAIVEADKSIWPVEVSIKETPASELNVPPAVPVIVGVGSASPWL